MSKAIKISFSVAACIVSIGMLLVSCDKAGQERGNCLAVVVPDTLRFNVYDKDTKENLFLSDNPKYDLEQLQLFAKMPGREELEAIEYLISDDQSHLCTYVTAGSANNIIFLQIEEQEMDEITYTFKRVDRLGCPYYMLDQVTFNDETAEKKAHGRVIPFYRN